MAERRFHEFVVAEKYRASFEEAIGQLEEFALPVYRKVVREQRLTGEAEERTFLGFLMAFQLVRTRSQRDQFRQMEQLLASKLERMGAKLEDLDGWEPLTEDRLTRQHIGIVRDSIPQFAAVIATKDLLLMKAPPERSFYLSDNPVALHNSQPADPFFGNIGLAVEGIEIYMPLSPSLTLAAWCPSLLSKQRNHVEELRRAAAAPLLAGLQAGRLTAEQMRREMDELERTLEPATTMIRAANTGEPLQVGAANVDYCNSLQVRSAREFIICQKQDFALARQFMTENPDHEGPRMRDMSEAPIEDWIGS